MAPSVFIWPGLLTYDGAALTSAVPLLLGGASASGANGNIFLPNGGDVGIAFRNAANNASPATIQMDSSDRLYFRNTATGISRFDTVVDATGGFRLNGVVTMSATAPTIASGFGTSPSIAASNGTAAFTVNVGTGGSATAGVITMPAATTGWIAHVENITRTLANGADQRTVQIASSTTTISLENQTISTGAVLAWTASDILVVSCVAY